MSNPLVQAFFVGRAVAEVINERVERSFTDALSELGKVDAELKEQLHQFTEEVMERANRSAEVDFATSSTTTSSDSETGDVQATIDELRAEIALLRTELQNYRSQI
ncbi:MAG: hypothetical protein QNJ63_04980 [Calothrix sp. MO_192.B10]|nr:hypothetical protein [Calothrix sp. MO_192.B10]